MVEKIQAIDQEIEGLKTQLNQVEGRETEVYSRIVGYYRSVRNWNLGKRGEYQDRVTFSKLNGRNITPVSGKNKEEEVIYTSEDKQDYWSYSYFYRTTCPNCPPMKEALKNVNLKAQAFNVDQKEGMEEAAKLNIFSAPTVVFFDKEGNEVFRTGNSKDIHTLTIKAATA